MKNPFKKFTVYFQYNNSMKQPIQVEALTWEQAKEIATKRMRDAYGTELAAKHKIVE